MPLPSFLEETGDRNFKPSSLWVRVRGTGTILTLDEESERFIVKYSRPQDPSVRDLRWYYLRCAPEDAIRTFITTYSQVTDHREMISPLDPDSWTWPIELRREGRLASGPGRQVDGQYESGDWLMPSYFYVGGYRSKDEGRIIFYRHALDLSNLMESDAHHLETIRQVLVEMGSPKPEPPWVPSAHTRFQMID